MAVPLVKITIVVGAGIVGSMLAQEGGASKLTDFFTGATKIVFKHLKEDKSPSKPKPQNDFLLAQVNSLRQELEHFASSRSVTVISTNSNSGTGAYVLPICITVVAGCGYARWKGWKLSDMMFATRRSLADACSTVQKQLEHVHVSISAAKRHLSSRIDVVNKNLDECGQITAETKDEVTNLRGDLKGFNGDLKYMEVVVKTLETKIGRIEEKQDFTNSGVLQLCEIAHRLEKGGQMGDIQGLPSSSRLSIEPPGLDSITRATSMPTATVALESASPNGGSPSTPEESPKVSRQLHHAISASGLKEIHGISDPPSSETPTQASELRSSGSSNFVFSRMKLPILGATFLTRTNSAR